MQNKFRSIFRTVALSGCILGSAIVIAQAPGPDFSKATEALGISTAELATALGSPPDFDTAAEKLGVEPKELISLLPAPPEDEIPEGYTADDFMQAE